jgi:hypothetical protein
VEAQIQEMQKHLREVTCKIEKFTRQYKERAAGTKGGSPLTRTPGQAAPPVPADAESSDGENRGGH